MKKPLLVGMVAFSSLLSAQQLISFENTEGFTLGNVHGQQGWMTGVIRGGNMTINNSSLLTTNIPNMNIVDNQFFHGTHALQLSPNNRHNSVTIYDLLGAFHTLSTSIDTSNFTVSYDVKIEELDGSEYIFQGMNTSANGIAQVYLINFSYDGDVLVGITTPNGVDLAQVSSWTPNTWHRVKIVGTATGVKYYLDNNLIAVVPHLNPANTTMNRIDFVHDNDGNTGAFVDRIAINNEAALSVKETAETNTAITIYPNPTADVLHISSEEKIHSVAIFDMTGRRMNAELKAHEVDVNHFPKGNYIITISTEKGKVSKKWIKK
ncbi:T9SS type A sorting domain-containing protein [Bergeyella zoohelcum]|uniref:Por secretion system C-terminal sorting domain n=1 Tax=Bergeyella zoohelcum TaxID=1015 RepID=A0A7Z9CG23_9FLAO|nr:T9SS type A sorting domain-containing protein [Bergeyella zoohelcum]VDH04349.1 Por secretion system C-terminal sorting domain [Bergeyella zoohelcum]